jgi:tetratricopeptide (TPR) repeat protein
VAWITELKNTLSALFYLTSAWAYIEFDERRQRRWYAAALALFVLGLLSKPVTATLPAALLVLFWWRRGRLSWRRDGAPLLPWLGLGALSALFTAWVERALTGAEGEEFSLSAIERFLLAGRALWFYLGKIFWPSSLIFVYPRWTVDQTVWWHYLPPLGAACLLAGLWLLRGRSRAPLAAMLFFAGTLVPTLGFVNLYLFRYSFVADHFLYLPSLGVIVLVSAGIVVGPGRLPARAMWTGHALAALLVGVLGVLTWRQCSMYSDAETLYRTTLGRNPDCWMAYNNLGNILTGSGRAPEAVELLTRAVRLRPNLADIRNNLGNALAGQGRIPEAIEQYAQALKLKPDFAQARNNLGNALAGQGRPAEAIEQYAEALKLKPDDPEAHYNIANALAETGRTDAAIGEYGLALLLRPDYADAHYNLANSLLRAGRIAEAIDQYGRTLRLKPDYAEAHNNMGIALTRSGRTEEAIEQFNQALRIEPGFEQARANLRKARESLAERP